MSERKSWSSTVVGWFVERPAEDPPAAADSPPVGDADAVPEPPPPTEPATRFPQGLSQPDGKVDFAAVYGAAGIEPAAQARVAKAIELLTKLPSGTEPAVKQQIVSAALDAFGVPTNEIIESAVQELQALDAYATSDAADARRLQEESQRRITEFEREIERIKTVMAERGAEHEAVLATCNGAKLEVQKVLEFFGREAVAQVVSDSPKLSEPSPRKV